MAGLDLAHLLPPAGTPVTIAEAHVRIVLVDGKVKLHVDEKVGPLNGPPLDFEIDPLHALQVATSGVGSIIGKALEHK